MIDGAFTGHGDVRLMVHAYTHKHIAHEMQPSTPRNADTRACMHGRPPAAPADACVHILHMIHDGWELRHPAQAFTGMRGAGTARDLLWASKRIELAVLVELLERSHLAVCHICSPNNKLKANPVGKSTRVYACATNCCTAFPACSTSYGTHARESTLSMGHTHAEGQGQGAGDREQHAQSEMSPAHQRNL